MMHRFDSPQSPGHQAHSADLVSLAPDTNTTLPNLILCPLVPPIATSHSMPLHLLRLPLFRTQLKCLGMAACRTSWSRHTTGAARSAPASLLSLLHRAISAPLEGMSDRCTHSASLRIILPETGTVEEDEDRTASVDIFRPICAYSMP